MKRGVGARSQPSQSAGPGCRVVAAAAGGRKVGGPGRAAPVPALPPRPVPPRAHDAAVPDVGGVQSRGREALPRRPHEGKRPAGRCLWPQPQPQVGGLPGRPPARPPETAPHRGGGGRGGGRRTLPRPTAPPASSPVTGPVRPRDGQESGSFRGPKPLRRRPFSAPNPRGPLWVYVSLRAGLLPRSFTSCPWIRCPFPPAPGRWGASGPITRLFYFIYFFLTPPKRA